MDPRVFASLPDRDLRREGLLIGEGRLVAARVAQRCRPLALLAESSAASEAVLLAAGRCPVTVLESAEIEAIVGYPFHRGILIAAERPKPIACDAALVADLSNAGAGGSKSRGKPRGRLVVLPNPTDAENLGAIARSAAALGWDGLVLGPSSCDPFGRRALRCSMAATLVLPIYAAESSICLDLLRDEGWTTFAAALESDAAEPSALGEIDRIALVLGNERDGIPIDWRGRCSGAVAIPQGRHAADGVDSLNVAAAAAILLWEGRSRTISKDSENRAPW
jgi:tRNA G18 (ribose-2'-O)-methylase SpoU